MHARIDQLRPKCSSKINVFNRKNEINENMVLIFLIHSSRRALIVTDGDDATIDRLSGCVPVLTI